MYSNELVCKILDYLNQNINKEITSKELSSLFFFDKAHIMRLFKKELGITIHDYINTIRIYNSLKYFRDNNYIASIAYNNGFNSIEYFSETFKKILGVNPAIFKKYINRNLSITYNQEKLIVDNIVKIKGIKDSIEKYLNNKKPKISPIKTIIFKKEL